MVSIDLSKFSIAKESRSQRPGRPKAWWAIGLGLLALAALVYAFMPRAVSVRTSPVVLVYPSQQYLVLNASGYVVAQRRAAVSTKATGRLEWLGVEEGSLVREGDLIARLDARDLKAQHQATTAQVTVATENLAQARAELREAERELARTVELTQQGFLSPATRDAARTRWHRAAAAAKSAAGTLKVAQANQSAAQVSVDYSYIRAPFDGVVLTKTANVGDVLTPFSSAADSKGAVVTIADMDTLEVEVDVSESSIGRITQGMTAEIVLDALPEERFLGQVSRTVPTVDRSKGTVSAKIRFERKDPRILPDMSAKVSFLSQPVGEADQEPMLAVSSDAVVLRAGQSVVFKVGADGKTQQVPVKTGLPLGEQVTIEPRLLRALRSGDKVVSKPGAALADGAFVTAQASR